MSDKMRCTNCGHKPDELTWYEDHAGRSQLVRPPTHVEAMEALLRASEHVYALCTGDERWSMRIPADPERDSDIIIMTAITSARKLIESLDATDGQD